MAQRVRHNDYLMRPAQCRNLFTPAECAQIIALPDQPGEAAEIDQAAETGRINENERKTIVYPLRSIQPEHWLNQRVQSLFETVNQQFFHFHLDYHSGLTLLEYGPGGFFNWHVDLGMGDSSSRKLSLIAFLSDPADYTGGRLLMGTQEQEMVQNQGSAIIFPAYLVHRVEPVATGVRHALVSWAHGHAFS